MYDDKSNFEQRFKPFWGRLQIEPNQQVQKLEEQLRQNNLIFREDIQKLLKLAYHACEPAIRESVIHRLKIALDTYNVKKIREPDPFKPYGSEYLLSQGNVHLLDQMDGVPWLIPMDTPLTGVLILGPQQSGKSRFIIRLCLEIQKVNPAIVITIIDPKGAFGAYAPLLSADTIDLGEKPIGLKAPDSVSERKFILEFMPPLADSLGLIYGVEILNEAALIALAQKQKYIEATGQETELCLKDVHVALSLVQNTSSGRRQGYREAAQTALRRILGEQNLFSCRKGVSLDRLYSRNSIINARNLTDNMQCRALALFFLYWKYQQSRNKPETNNLEHLIIIDDASRFIGTPGNQFEAASRTSPLGNILATLRASGTGLAAATQLPAYIDSSVLALSRTMIAIGPTSGSQHLKVISDFMSLDKERTRAITRLSSREVVGFAPGTAYKDCIHGWVPFVEAPPILAVDHHSESTDAFEVKLWYNLADIPVPAISKTKPQQPTAVTKTTGQLPVHPTLLGVSANTQKILWDCICYSFSSVSARIKRLGMSGRAFDDAKREACEKGLLIESAAGQTLYLIPTKKTFEVFGIDNPYKRVVSVEHAFYVGLGCFLLEKDPGYKSVRTEVPIGKAGAASDIVTVAHDGRMEAWEVCLGTSHLLANVTKYKNIAYSKIVLLARNYELSTAIKSFIRVSGLDPDLMAKIEFMHFSQLLRRQRKLSLY